MRLNRVSLYLQRLDLVIEQLIAHLCDLSRTYSSRFEYLLQGQASEDTVKRDLIAYLDN